jgi:hypothetical protein
MKNSNDTTGNRICELPVCSVVPQSTAPPRAPVSTIKYELILLGEQIEIDRNKHTNHINTTDKMSGFLSVTQGRTVDTTAGETIYRRVKCLMCRST